MHKKFTKRFFTFIVGLALAGSLAACGSADSGTTSGTASGNASSVTTAAGTSADTEKEGTAAADPVTTASAAAAATEDGKVVTTAASATGGAIDTSDIFSDRDLTQTPDLSEATTYTVSDGQGIEITSAGVYVLTGSASNVTVTVNAGDEDKVQIVLDGVSITNDTQPAIFVKNADKVFVTTTEGSENSLTVSDSFTEMDGTNTDAVIFSKDDLVMNGLGTLNISSSKNGITSKDDLKLTGGIINLSVADAALEANDSIAVADGSITVSASNDAMHAENDDDNSKGYIYICGGTLNLTSADDGVHATTIVQIDGGTLNIKAAEGIEGTWVQINDGDIDISASDDGINAANKSSSYSPKVEVNGGSTTIAMGQGDTDGVDSNGDIIINGGTISVTGQSTFDYDGNGVINGGTVICNGEEVTTLPNQMMGGGMGGRGGMGGQEGFDPGSMDPPEGFDPDSKGGRGGFFPGGKGDRGEGH